MVVHCKPPLLSRSLEVVEDAAYEATRKIFHEDLMPVDDK